MDPGRVAKMDYRRKIMVDSKCFSDILRNQGKPAAVSYSYSSCGYILLSDG